MAELQNGCQSETPLLSQPSSHASAGGDSKLTKLSLIFPHTDVSRLTEALKQSDCDFERSVDWLIGAGSPAAVSADSRSQDAPDANENDILLVTHGQASVEVTRCSSAATAAAVAECTGDSAADSSISASHDIEPSGKAQLAQLIRQFLDEGKSVPRVAGLVRRLLDGAVDTDEFIESLPPHIGVGQLSAFGDLARRFLPQLRDDAVGRGERIDTDARRGRKRRADDSSASPPDVPRKLAAVDEPPSHAPDDIIERVKLILSILPDANADVLFARLEDAADLDDTAQRLIEELQTPAAVDEAEARPSDEPIMERVNVILALHPSADGDALYNRLERATDIDEELRRVVDELQRQVAGPSHLPRADGGAAEFLSASERADLATVCQVFADADPYYVVEQLVQNRASCEQLIEKMTTSSYPKYRVRLERERRDRRRSELLNPADFSVEEFLQVFAEPENYFATAERAVTDLYKQHARVFLHNRYPIIRPEYIDSALENCGGRLLPTIRFIESPDRRNDRIDATVWPEQVDEPFFREMQFVLNENKVNAFMQRREAARAARLAEAREKGELQECQCCFADDVLPEETITCDNAAELHRFCRECVGEHAETQIAAGRTEIGCLAGGCDEHYAVESLRALVRPASYGRLLRRCQQRELRVADIANLEACPSCDFAMIIDNEQERVFRCRNADCLKETCRLCKEESHVPLKCEEVERDAETQMRTFVENRMAEAMIRVCPKCGNRIMRQGGCNYMACPCGALFCYACRRPTPQDHVCDCGGDGANIEHTAEAKRAGHEARQTFLHEAAESVRNEIRHEVNITDLVDRKLEGYA